jgi:hypothetical protein
MQLLRSGSKSSVAGPMTIRLRPARVWVTMAALMGAVFLLAAGTHVHAQSRMATPSSLGLLVRPEVLLQDQNGSIVLKIRLARGTTARLWAANSCTSFSLPSQVILASGTYTIPLNTLTPVSSKPVAVSSRVCLVSSDGVLNDSLPVEFLETGYGTSVQGAKPLISRSADTVNVPDGWAVTTREGMTTWSNP